MNAAADLNQTPIDSEAKLGHSISLIDVWWRKQLCPKRSEDFLGGNQKISVVFSTPGNIEQSDKDAFGTHPNGIIEIPGNPFAQKHRRYVGSLHGRKRCGNGLHGLRNCLAAGEKLRQHAGNAPVRT